jgi:hypothetical protein
MDWFALWAEGEARPRRRPFPIRLHQ